MSTNPAPRPRRPAATPKSTWLCIIIPWLLLLASCATHVEPQPPPPATARILAPPPPAAPGQSSRQALEAPLEITWLEAVTSALQHNRGLTVQRMNPALRQTLEEQAQARFDPILRAGLSGSRGRDQTPAGESRQTTALQAEAGIARFFDTGTRIDLQLETARLDSDAQPAEPYTTRAGLVVGQALLQGAGREVNLAELRQARLDTELSIHELQAFIETLVAQVETIYWDYVLARSQVRIFEESLELAQRQLAETRQRIDVGDLAETELAASQAELALRQEALINARSRQRSLQVRLLRLIQPQLSNPDQHDVVPRSQPQIPVYSLGSPAEHLAMAQNRRPEVRQAELLLERGQLELIKTRNGLLPRMDAFVRLGTRGYADSFLGGFEDLTGDRYELTAGLEFEMPWRNRAARSRHTRASISLSQQEESLRNLVDLVREDVETAIIEVHRARQQVAATAATRHFQEEKLRAENAKFRVGRTTAILVAAAQRDLVASQVAEVEALTSHLKALVNLFRAEGTLLERRGIALVK